MSFAHGLRPEFRFTNGLYYHLLTFLLFLCFIFVLDSPEAQHLLLGYHPSHHIINYTIYVFAFAYCVCDE